jgi:hypothetical protein
LDWRRWYDGGYTAKVGDVLFIVPAVTVDSEAFQAVPVMRQLLVSHPARKAVQTKQESVAGTQVLGGQGQP